MDSRGQPAPRERVERGRTPGVSDKEGHGGADGAWTPPPAGPGSGQSGDRGSWANTALDRAISRESSQEGCTPEQGQPISDYLFQCLVLFLDAWTVVRQTSLSQEKERGV